MGLFDGNDLAFGDGSQLHDAERLVGCKRSAIKHVGAEEAVFLREMVVHPRSKIIFGDRALSRKSKCRQISNADGRPIGQRVDGQKAQH